MKILATEHAADLFLGNTGEDRPKGVHLSDILSRMAWDRDRRYHPDAPKDLTAFESGFTWETVLSRALAERHGDRAGHRPAPFQEDGIWMSPDWVAPESDIQVEEWKSTRKSITRANEKVEEWGPQVKSYLRALLRKKVAIVPRVRLRVWFICGDWSFEAKGDLNLLRDYYTIDLEFEKRELDENWRSIVSYGQKNGMLPAPPKDPTWRRPQLEATLQRRLADKTKRSGNRRAPSPESGRIVTFPPTKRPRKRRSAS